MIIFAMYQMFGMKNEEIWPLMGGQITIFVIILFVIIIGLTSAFKSDVSPFPGERSGEVQEVVVEEGGQPKQVRSEVIKSIVHPRVLGAIFILVVASFVVKILVDKPKEK